MNATVKIPHAVIVRVPGLLPMRYKLRELAQDLGISSQTLRGWVNKFGVPHTRDRRGHIWISGPEFARWVDQMRRARRKKPVQLAPDAAYCFGCGRAVNLVNPSKRRRGKLTLLHASCPHCGTAIFRGTSNG